MVISVDGPSAAQVDTFRLRQVGGDVLEFRVGVLNLSNGGLPAPHLREHFVSGQPITVWFTSSEEGLVAVRYEDAS